jgi:hypothetical protein
MGGGISEGEVNLLECKSRRKTHTSVEHVALRTPTGVEFELFFSSLTVTPPWS